MTKHFEVGDRVRVTWVDDQDIEVGIVVGDVATVEGINGVTLHVTFNDGLQRFMLCRQMEIVQ